MPVSTIPGLEGVRTKLEQIQKDCNAQTGNQDDSKKDGEKDEFIKNKATCYGMLTIVREKIRFRFQVIKEKGNNVEAIQLGVKIQSMLHEMDKLMPKLQAVLAKQSEGSFLRKRLKPEEIEERYKDLAVLKRHVQDCETSFKGNRDLSKEDFEDAWVSSQGTSGQREQLFGTGTAIQVDQTGRQVEGREQELIDRWAAKDKEFDAMIDDIACDVEQLGHHAANIGAAAERQGILIDEVGRKVSVADQGVKDLSSRVRDIIAQDKNSTFVCRIIMILVLLGIAGIIFSKLTK
eukprot:GEMP01012065.1.p1 GENE.GEMP01012065.1~~GEMP01012065.1.p1  ORF type:complete len:291 (+),score=51.09 GEMP01012065.1:32-904(+)